MDRARSGLSVNIVPRINGMSIRDKPANCAATMIPVSVTVAAIPNTAHPAQSMTLGLRSPGADGHRHRRCGSSGGQARAVLRQPRLDRPLVGPVAEWGGGADVTLDRAVQVVRPC